MRILLIAGGWSDERRVSLDGAGHIKASLRRQGHTVVFFDLQDGLAKLGELAADCDFAFLNLHGAPGEDGLIQALLDRLGLPYQGSDPAGSMLALDKAAAKAIFARHNLPTPPWVFLSRTPGSDFTCPFGPPMIVKPNQGGSSLGIELVRRMDDLLPAVERILAKGRQVLVEKYQPGVEVTCAVLGQEALPLILIRPDANAEFFDYQSKYIPGQAEEICPAPLSRDVSQGIKSMALLAHNSLGLRGYSRADFILHEGQVHLLEVNTLPGMTATSLLPQAAAVHGLNFDHLIARLMQLGVEESGVKSECLPDGR